MISMPLPSYLVSMERILYHLKTFEQNRMVRRHELKIRLVIAE